MIIFLKQMKLFSVTGVIFFVCLFCSCNNGAKVVVHDVKLEEIKQEVKRDEPPPPPPPKVRKSIVLHPALATMDFTDWLTGICRNEKLPKKIIAYHFGIIDVKNSIGVYLTGSEQYDSKNGDWTMNEDYTPRINFFTFPKKNFSSAAQSDVEAGIAQRVREFMKTDIYKRSFLASATAVTTGFSKRHLIVLQ
jgi:hypothetical protein